MSEQQTAMIVDETFPTTIDFNGRTLRVQIKRFDLNEYTEFIRDFQRCSNNGKKDAVFVEMHRSAPGEDADTVRARLELTAGDDVLAKLRAREDAEEKFATDFLVKSITDYVSIDAGQLARRDGTPIVNGADVLRVFAGRQDLLQELLSTIYTENCLSDESKKKLAELRASRRSSTESTPTVDGDAPGPIASSASEPGSAPAATATA